MASDVNSVTLTGRLTRDPELRHTAGNKAVCMFGVAVNRRYQSNNEWKDDTTFLDCECWGRQAEAMGGMQRGALVFVGGRLKMDEWQDKQSGQKRTKLKIVADSCYQLLVPAKAAAAPAESGDDIPF